MQQFLLILKSHLFSEVFEEREEERREKDGEEGMIKNITFFFLMSLAISAM